MTSKEFSDIAGALAWPVTAVISLAVFYKPIRSLLDTLTATMTLKAVKIRAFGVEVDLTPEQAKRALNELLQDIADSTNELAPDEWRLFERVIASAGRDTVADLIPGFQRYTPEHQQLRKLRDRMLIRPVETGTWNPRKHPVVSRFGQLVYDLRKAGGSERVEKGGKE